MQYLKTIIYRYKGSISLVAQEGASKYASIRVVAYSGSKKILEGFTPYISTNFKLMLRLNLKGEVRKIVLLDISAIESFTDPDEISEIVRDGFYEGILWRMEIVRIADEGQTPLIKSKKSTSTTERRTPPLPLKVKDVEESSRLAESDKLLA